MDMFQGMVWGRQNHRKTLLSRGVWGSQGGGKQGTGGLKALENVAFQRGPALKIGLPGARGRGEPS